MHKLLILLTTLIGLFQTVSAQYCDNNVLGLKVGVGMTKINNLGNSIITPGYYSNYSFTDNKGFSPSAEIFYGYHKKDALFGLEVAAIYYQMRTDSEYSDIYGLKYTIGYKYHYLGAKAMLKVYPVGGLYVAPTFRGGACLNPEGVSYESNQDEAFLAKFKYSSSASTRECLKEKLSGRPEVGVGGTIGYEFPIGITVSGDYLYTVTDLVATSVNAYGWTEQENRAHTVRVMVGYAIGLITAIRSNPTIRCGLR